VCGRSLDALACPSLSLCLAGDWGGSLIAITNPAVGGSSWSEAFFGGEAQGANRPSSARIATTGFVWPAVGPIACGSPSMCIAMANRGLIGSSDPAGGPAAWNAPTRPLDSRVRTLACPSATFCAATLASEVLTTDTPLTAAEWDYSGEVDPPATHEETWNSVSCASSYLCVVVDSAGNVVVGRAKLPSGSRIRAFLAGELAPHGAAARIGSLLAHDGFPLSVNPPSQGGLRVRWLYAPSRLPGAGHTRPLVVARGEGGLPEAEHATVQVSLTKTGAVLLRHRERVRLTAEAVFTSPHGRPLIATRPFTLRR